MGSALSKNDTFRINKKGVLLTDDLPVYNTGLLVGVLHDSR